MRQRNRVLLVAACLAAALSVVAVWLRNQEPSYHHHSLAYWTRLYLNGDGNAPAAPDQQQLADDAVRHIGTNAIPYLLNWFEYDAWPRVERNEAFRRKLPGPIRTNTFLMRLLCEDPKEIRAETAMLALAALGPEAGSAAPELVRVLGDTNAVLAQRAAVVLVRIGPAAVPAMTAAATNRYNPNRYDLVRSIEALGTNGSFAAPVLVSLLQDPDEGIRLGAQTTLAAIRNAASVTGGGR